LRPSPATKGPCVKYKYATENANLDGLLSCPVRDKKQASIHIVLVAENGWQEI